MESYKRKRLVPYEVCTGSFNFTYNATNSLENLICVKDKKITNAYYQELAQILAVSEPLDWTSKWCYPDWRLGT
jgi:phosphatidylserine/phosphatidylglycerophosphate/cardiolipin synthase-like enzyme